jgi:hypothetical protein
MNVLGAFGLAATVGSQAAALGLILTSLVFGADPDTAFAGSFGLALIAAACIVGGLASGEGAPAKALVAWGTGVVLGGLVVCFGGRLGLELAAAFW